MPDDSSPLTVTREDAAGGTGRFILSEGGQPIGTLDFHSDTGILYIDFVEVSPAVRGRSLGRHLVKAAVHWARESGRKVVPFCSYSRAVIVADSELRDSLG